MRVCVPLLYDDNNATPPWAVACRAAATDAMPSLRARCGVVVSRNALTHSDAVPPSPRRLACVYDDKQAVLLCMTDDDNKARYDVMATCVLHSCDSSTAWAVRMHDSDAWYTTTAGVRCTALQRVAAEAAATSLVLDVTSSDRIAHVALTASQHVVVCTQRGHLLCLAVRQVADDETEGGDSARTTVHVTAGCHTRCCNDDNDVTYTWSSDAQQRVVAVRGGSGDDVGRLTATIVYVDNGADGHATLRFTTTMTQIDTPAAAQPCSRFASSCAVVCDDAGDLYGVLVSSQTTASSCALTLYARRRTDDTLRHVATRQLARGEAAVLCVHTLPRDGRDVVALAATAHHRALTFTVWHMAGNDDDDNAATMLMLHDDANTSPLCSGCWLTMTTTTTAQACVARFASLCGNGACALYHVHLARARATAAWCVREVVLCAHVHVPQRASALVAWQSCTWPVLALRDANAVLCGVHDALALHALTSHSDDSDDDEAHVTRAVARRTTPHAASSALPYVAFVNVPAATASVALLVVHASGVCSLVTWHESTSAEGAATARDTLAVQCVRVACDRAPHTIRSGTVYTTHDDDDVSIDHGSNDDDAVLQATCVCVLGYDNGSVATYVGGQLCARVLAVHGGAVTALATLVRGAHTAQTCAFASVCHDLGTVCLHSGSGAKAAVVRVLQSPQRPLSCLFVDRAGEYAYVCSRSRSNKRTATHCADVCNVWHLPSGHLERVVTLPLSSLSCASAHASAPHMRTRHGHAYDDYGGMRDAAMSACVVAPLPHLVDVLQAHTRGAWQLRHYTLCGRRCVALAIDVRALTTRLCGDRNNNEYGGGGGGGRSRSTVRAAAALHLLLMQCTRSCSDDDKLVHGNTTSRTVDSEAHDAAAAAEAERAQASGDDALMRVLQYAGKRVATWHNTSVYLAALLLASALTAYASDRSTAVHAHATRARIAAALARHVTSSGEHDDDDDDDDMRVVMLLCTCVVAVVRTLLPPSSLRYGSIAAAQRTLATLVTALQREAVVRALHTLLRATRDAQQQRLLRRLSRHVARVCGDEDDNNNNNNDALTAQTLTLVTLCVADACRAHICRHDDNDDNDDDTSSRSSIRSSSNSHCSSGATAAADALSPLSWATLRAPLQHCATAALSHTAAQWHVACSSHSQQQQQPQQQTHRCSSDNSREDMTMLSTPSPWLCASAMAFAPPMLVAQLVQQLALVALASDVDGNTSSSLCDEDRVDNEGSGRAAAAAAAQRTLAAMAAQDMTTFVQQHVRALFAQHRTLRPALLQFVGRLIDDYPHAFTATTNNNSDDDKGRGGTATATAAAASGKDDEHAGCHAFAAVLDVLLMALDPNTPSKATYAVCATAALRTLRTAACRLPHVALQPHFRHLAVGQADGSVRVYNLTSASLIARFVAHDAAVRAVAYSSNTTSHDIATASVRLDVVKTWRARRSGGALATLFADYAKTFVHTHTLHTAMPHSGGDVAATADAAPSAAAVVDDVSSSCDDEELCVRHTRLRWLSPQCLQLTSPRRHGRVQLTLPA